MRHDKTAPQKLYILLQLDKVIQDHFPEETSSWQTYTQLPQAEKSRFCSRFTLTGPVLKEMIARRQEFSEFVSQRRLTQSGIRPFGAQSTLAK